MRKTLATLAAVTISACFIMAGIGSLYSQTFTNPVTLLYLTSSTGQPIGVSPQNPLPVSASVTASVSGFVPSLSYNTCTSTGSQCTSTALPTNTGSVVLFNTGTTTVSCTLASGTATAAASELQIPASSGLGLGTTGYDHYACIDQTGSTSNVVVASGGTGLPTGWGGGSGGGSSSTITNWGSGTNTLGAMANYGTSPGAVLVPGVNAFVTNTNANGQAVMASSSPVVIASDQSAVAVNPQPATSGGLSNYFVQPAASDNHAVIKAGAGQVYKISVTNNSATVNYLRLYNATTGFNGCGSASNLVYETAIPANTAVAGIVDSWNQGLAFATGISICVTSGYATTDTTSATASAMNVNIGFK